MFFNKPSLFLWLFFLPICSTAQEEILKLGLSEIIVLAQSDAPDVLIAQTRFSNRYWSYQSFLADFKPQISLTSDNAPFLRRAINPITLPDGSIAFINQSLMQNGLNLRLQQQIPATGGTIFTNTGLERIDIFNSGAPNDVSYQSTPLSINYIQPIFQYNRQKWQRIIQPLSFEIAEKSYSEDLEQIAFDATNLFFDVLNAQLSVEAAGKDKADADTLYNISKGRFEVGRIAETDLLQIELSARNAEQSLATATLALQTATNELRDFLGIQQAVRFELLPPYEIPDIQINAVEALTYARQHRSAIINFQRRLREAESGVAEAKGITGPSADLFVSLGLSQTGKTLGDAYNSPLDQERMSVSFQIPIADWGKARATLETAKSNQALTKMLVDQDRTNFEREILLKVQQFDLVRNQVALAKRTYEVAQKTNSITRQRYLVGKIGITELNIALNQQESSRQAYVRALQSFWIAYYNLRLLTLYDFIRDKALVRSSEVEE
ncbi:MAG: TolC family protein [Bacteroidota bacterium]